LTRGIAATTVLAVVAAIALSACLVALALRAYVPTFSAVAGGDFVIISTPPLPREVVLAELRRPATDMGVSLLLASDQSTARGTELSFVPLVGDVGSSATSRVQYRTTPGALDEVPDLRGFYVTDATGSAMDELVRALRATGFTVDVTTETLGQHVVSAMTAPGVALAVLGTAALVAQAAAAEAVRGRRVGIVRALAGWSRWQRVRGELEGFTVLVALSVVTALLVFVVSSAAWGGPGVPALAAPVLVPVVVCTGVVLLLVRALPLLPDPLRRSRTARAGGVLLADAPAVRRVGHVLLTALVVLAVLAALDAATATRRAIEAQVLLEPYASMATMRLGPAGVAEERFQLALADLTRDQLRAGTAVLRDTTSEPGTLVLASTGADVRGTPRAAPTLWAREEPGLDRLALLGQQLTWDPLSEGWNVPVEPALDFDVRVVRDPADAAGVRDAALVPEVVPFDTVVTVPADDLSWNVLATATGNGETFFTSSRSVDDVLAAQGLQGYVASWQTVGDRVAIALAESRHDLVVTLSATVLALGLLLASAVRRARTHALETRDGRRALASAGRSSWSVDVGPAVRRTATSTASAVVVVPVVLVLAPTQTATALFMIVTVALVDLAASGATLALTTTRLIRKDHRRVTTP